MKVYLDNAATTPLDPIVFEAMKPLMLEYFGNPSSIHGHGRTVRAHIERSRSKVATLLKTSPGEIFFTSGGTEADNATLFGCVNSLGVDHIITSKIEHHAVLHTAELLSRQQLVKLSFVNLKEAGQIDLEHLETLLKIPSKKTLVSLMHANNEIGNLIDLKKIGALAHQYEALFHTDTVQTMGHIELDLSVLPVDFLVGSAHKFNGPKGVGFLYINSHHKINPFINGGAQERNMRGGTENVYGIVGLAKALEISCKELNEQKSQILNLKKYMIDQLMKKIPDVQFNGQCADLNDSLYTVLNVCLPPTPHNEMLLFNLDISGISASGGSACSSGSNISSHVLAELNRDPKRGAVRFSFSKYNNKEEIAYTVETLSKLIHPTK
ncbi:MAG: cysteine desulfurase [Flammeovirgaceae bacterium]|nr:cysteine desulfurase [Flammeovirgaceae bacterium]